MISELHKAIIADLKDKLPVVEVFGFYPSLRGAVKAPAIFIDLTSMEPGTDPGTGQLAIIGRFAARVIMACGNDLEIRELSAETARIIYHNNFGMQVSPAKLVSITQDGFSPDLDAYDMWLVEWEHELHLGDSIWDGSGVIVQEIFINGEQLDAS